MDSSTPSPPSVRIEIDDDDHASRIETMLRALGYEVERANTSAAWRIRTLATRCKLTMRETEILDKLVHGESMETIGQGLELSKATVKWHRHNIFVKTNTANVEGIQRMLLIGERTEAVAS